MKWSGCIDAEFGAVLGLVLALSAGRRVPALLNYTTAPVSERRLYSGWHPERRRLAQLHRKPV